MEKQRETHRRMLEQLLLAEQAHKQALFKLEDEKRNHGEFMKKSDEFTNLLEQERERSEPSPLAWAGTYLKLHYCEWPLGGWAGQQNCFVANLDWILALAPVGTQA